jgi:molecular chaperone GrpE
MTEPASRTTSGQQPIDSPAAADPAAQQEGLIRADQGQEAAAPEAATPITGPDAAELEDRWRRALADLDNLRKRYARELARERTAERDLVTAAFLPVLDTVDRALEHAEADPRSIVEGVRTLREQAMAVLSGLGYQREDAVAVPFDPARHEVVGVVETDASQAAPGSVVAVLRPGYGAADRQLRPAAVTVAQRSED